MLEKTFSSYSDDELIRAYKIYNNDDLYFKGFIETPRAIDVIKALMKKRMLNKNYFNMEKNKKSKDLQKKIEKFSFVMDLASETVLNYLSIAEKIDEFIQEISQGHFEYKKELRYYCLHNCINDDDNLNYMEKSFNRLKKYLDENNFKPEQATKALQIKNAFKEFDIFYQNYVR